MTTLISFLGRVAPERGSDYSQTRYDFAGTHRQALYFGLALAEDLRVDRLRILGTAGSQWDTLAFEVHNHVDDELMQAVREDRVTAAHLAGLEDILNQRAERHYELRLVPYGYDDAAQIDILRILSTGFGAKDRICLDVTHALRHLPMLGLLSSFYLQAVLGAQVESIYYAAFDRKQDNVTPVVKLDGLLRIYEWLSAMEQFNKDGDYGVFGDLLDREGLPGRLLAEAAFYERSANTSAARQKLETFARIKPAASTATGQLFLPELTKRIAWREGRSRAQWEASLAREYLKRRDYVRAVQFAYESLVTDQVEKTGGNDDDRIVREAADRTLYEAARHQNGRGRHGAFKTLKDLRNALAHGVRGDQDARIVELAASESTLQSWLAGTFDTLLVR